MNERAVGLSVHLSKLHNWSFAMEMEYSENVMNGIHTKLNDDNVVIIYLDLIVSFYLFTSFSSGKDETKKNDEFNENIKAMMVRQATMRCLLRLFFLMVK